jgi:hypothetical protein
LPSTLAATTREKIMPIVDFWVVVEPTFARWSPHPVNGARAVRLTQRRPRGEAAPNVVIKLRLSFPDHLFVPREFETDLAINEDLVLISPPDLYQLDARPEPEVDDERDS